MGFLSFALLSFLNQFFAYRSEPIVISQISIQVVALPIGHFLAWVLLEKKFSVFGRECSLNPGPFNVKEHVLISIFANAGASFGGGNAYAIGIVIIIKAFYKRNISFVTSLLLVITTQLGSPLVTPFFATANILVGYVLLVYIMLPVAYWVLNLYSASRYPPFSNELFDASGQLYNIHNIVNDKFEIDMDAYAKQGRIHLSLFFAVSYGLGFATIATTLSHVTFFYGKYMYQRFRESYKGKMDVHARLMKRYDDIPNWWFYILLEASMTVSMVLCTVFKEETPGLNIITEYCWGLIMPGKPIANVCFKVYGYMSMNQAVSFLRPRLFVGTVVASMVNTVVAWWLLTTVPYICEKGQLPEGSPWTCPGDHVFFDASVIWGLVGPRRIFGPLGYYSALNWFFLFGLAGRWWCGSWPGHCRGTPAGSASSTCPSSWGPRAA
ncbi:Oligopeptide transporter 4 [Hordeum vulgare]|nr:Oligopeptide transporter 4 [Hordeum vulgare]